MSAARRVIYRGLQRARAFSESIVSSSKSVGTESVSRMHVWMDESNFNHNPFGKDEKKSARVSKKFR